MKEEFGTKGFTFTPDGKTLAVAGSKGGIIKLLDVATGKESAKLAMDPRRPVIYVVISPDGKTLAAESENCSRVVLWDLPTRKVRATLPQHHGRAYSVAFTPDSKILATSVHFLLLWQAATGKPGGRLKPKPNDPESQCKLVCTPDGNGLIGACDGKVLLWDLTTGQCTEIYSTKKGFGFPDGLALSPDGRTLAVINKGSILLIDMIAHQERATIRGWKYCEYCPTLAFSPDGRTLAAGRADNRIVLFDLTGVQGEIAPDSVDLANLWWRLSRSNAADAYQAIRILTAFPRQSVSSMRKFLLFVPHPTEDQRRAIESYLSDLYSDLFDKRQKAHEELQKLGELAEDTLKRTLSGRPSLEVRKQVQRLLKRIAIAKEPRLLQHRRALEILEHMDDADARTLLADLAKDAPEALIRQEAKDSLARVRKRPPPTIIKPLPPEAPKRPKPARPAPARP